MIKTHSTKKREMGVCPNVFQVVTVLLFVQACQCCVPRWAEDQIYESIFQLSSSIQSCDEHQLLHQDSGTCHDYDSNETQRGPCGKNMVLVSTGTVKVGKFICKESSHPLVYIPTSNQRFKLFTQGPCLDGKWLEFDNGSVKCSPNPCDGMRPNEATVLLNGDCVFLGSTCPLSGRLNGRVIFNEQLVPVCQAMFMLRAVAGIGPAACPPNFYRSTHGRHCHEPIFFDFD